MFKWYIDFQIFPISSLIIWSNCFVWQVNRMMGRLENIVSELEERRETLEEEHSMLREDLESRRKELDEGDTSEEEKEAWEQLKMKVSKKKWVLFLTLISYHH